MGRRSLAVFIFGKREGIVDPFSSTGLYHAQQTTVPERRRLPPGQPARCAWPPRRQQLLVGALIVAMWLFITRPQGIFG